MYNDILALYWILQYLAAPPPMWHKGAEGGGGGLGPVNVQKSCHGKEGHPPSRVNLHVHVSECLDEKKFTPLPERRADSSARPCSDCLA